MAWAAVGAAAIGAVGAYSSSKNNKKAAQAGQTSTQSLDPRANNILYGDNEDGLLKYFQGFANSPQSAALQSYGNTSNNYLTNYAGGDTDAVRNAGYALLQNAQRPQSQGLGQAAQSTTQVGGYGTGGVAQIGTPQVQAPGQNSLNLKGAFDRTINGDEGANPYLTRGLQAGIDATNAGFANNQRNLTNQLTRQVLPGLKSDAIANGGFGGSRQGIAEGLALSDYTNQLTGANTQLGLANSANAIGAQAGAFNQGRDRSLSAMLNLSGQQYGAASQNANLALQAMQGNQAADNQARMFNATSAQNADLANQRNTQFNVGAINSNNMANLQNNQFNANASNAALLSGSGLLSGNLGQALSGATGAQNYRLSQAQASAGLLSPFIGMNSSTTSTQPTYSNTAGNVLGGAAAGLGLYNQFSNMNKGSNSAASASTGGSFGGSYW